MGGGQGWTMIAARAFQASAALLFVIPDLPDEPHTEHSTRWQSERVATTAGSPVGPHHGHSLSMGRAILANILPGFMALPSFPRFSFTDGGLGVGQFPNGFAHMDKRPIRQGDDCHGGSAADGLTGIDSPFMATLLAHLVGVAASED